MFREGVNIRSDTTVCSVICNFRLVQGHFENQFSYFSTKLYVVGSQKNRLNETVLLSTQNI